MYLLNPAPGANMFPCFHTNNDGSAAVLLSKEMNRGKKIPSHLSPGRGPQSIPFPMEVQVVTSCLPPPTHTPHQAPWARKPWRAQEGRWLHLTGRSLTPLCRKTAPHTGLPLAVRGPPLQLGLGQLSLPRSHPHP